MSYQQSKPVAPFPPSLIAGTVASMLSAIGLMLPMMGYAADVVVNGQTGTKVTSSSNGATVIQIATTKSDGTSYNGFALFNATNPKGTVFNNNAQTSTSTAWGTIAGNTALGAAATQIIAEVTGTQASTLSAGVGINGQKASLVLINPNGITVNGKVVTSNVAQATLVVGAANRTGDLVTSLDTSKAKTDASLTINGALQNPEGALALLSPAIKVAAGGSVSASNNADLWVVIGHATFDPRSARLLAVDGSAPSTVSVDASLLGAMNAGVINVISTRQGAGVNTGGIWAAQQGIKVDVQGGSLESSNAQLTANGVDGIALRASQSLSLIGGALTGSQIAIDGGRGVALTNGTITAAGNATLHSGGDLALNGYNVNATQNISATADQHVDMRVLLNTTEAVDPTVSTETSKVNVSGSLGFGLFRPLGINVSGSANLGASYSAGKSSTTTETVSTLRAGQDVNVNAGGVTTLTGTTVAAGGNATIQGAAAVNLQAAHDSASKNSISLSLQGGGTVSGVVPYLFGSGTVTLNGSVTGSANGAQSSSTTAKGVSITAGKDVTVQATQGDVLAEGVTISAGQNALIKASGNVTTGVATSTSSSFTETAALKGTVNVPVQVDSALNIVGTLFTGGSLLNNVQLTTVNVAGSGTGNIVGSTSTKQYGGSITAGQSVKVQADDTVSTYGTAMKAQSVSVNGSNGVKLGSAINSLAKLNVSGGGVLAQQNFLAAKQLKINLSGNLDGSVSVQGQGTNLQGAQINVDAAQGKTKLDGANIAGIDVSIRGAGGVDIGTSLDLTGSVNGAFNGPLDLAVSGLKLNLSTPTLSLSGGSIGVMLPKVDVSLNALVDLAVAGTAKGQMSIGGNGSQISGVQGVKVQASDGDIKLTGSKLTSGAGTTLEAPNGAIDLASSLRLSGSFDSQFNVGAKSLLDLSVSIHQLSLGLKPTSLRLAGIGLAVGADLSVGVGGLSLAGTSVPSLSTSLALSGTGRATLGSDASSIKAGQDVRLIAQEAVTLSKPVIQAGGQIDISGKSVAIKAPVTTTVTGQLSAALPVQLLPTLDVDFSQVSLSLGGTLALAQMGGELKATQGVNIVALDGGVSTVATNISTPATLSIKSADSIHLDAGTSLTNGKLAFTPTQLTAGSSVTYEAPAVRTFLLAPAVVTSPVITLNGQPK